MKRMIIAALLLLSGAAAYADGALDKIAEANRSVTNITCSFKQVKTLANKKDIKSKGTLYYCAPDRFSMIYTQPLTDRFIIRGDKMYNNRDNVGQHFDLSKTPAVKKLAATLLQAVAGQVEAVAVSNDADLKVQTEKKCYVVTLTARKKAARGYARIVLKYRKSDCMLTEMTMEEFSHITTTYKMDDFDKEAAIDKKVFDF